LNPSKDSPYKKLSRKKSQVAQHTSKSSKSHENDTEIRIENSNKGIMKRVSDDEEIRDQSSNLNETLKIKNDVGKHHQKRTIIKTLD
jgi:hypothetical protein